MATDKARRSIEYLEGVTKDIGGGATRNVLEKAVDEIIAVYPMGNKDTLRKFALEALMGEILIQITFNGFLFLSEVDATKVERNILSTAVGAVAKDIGPDTYSTYSVLGKSRAGAILEIMEKEGKNYLGTHETALVSARGWAKKVGERSQGGGEEPWMYQEERLEAPVEIIEGIILKVRGGLERIYHREGGTGL